MADAATQTTDTTAAPGATGATGAANTPWYSTADQETVGWMETKGYKADQLTPEIALLAIKNHRNAEKFIGAPADQLIRMPKEGDAKAMEAIYDKLGRPADPAKYDLALPDNADKGFVEWARGTFHKLGLNNTQAKELTAAFNAFNETAAKAKADASAADTQIQARELQKEWGAAFEQNAAVADRAAEVFGMGEKELMALKSAMGAAGAMKFLHNIGAKMGEDKFVEGKGGGGGFGAMTPAAAQAEIKALQTDSDFRTKLVNGDRDAKAKWERLHKMAYPE